MSLDVSRSPLFEMHLLYIQGEIGSEKHKMSSFMDSHESEEPLGDDAVGAGYGAGHLNAGTVG